MFSSDPADAVLTRSQALQLPLQPALRPLYSCLFLGRLQGPGVELQGACPLVTGLACFTRHLEGPLVVQPRRRGCQNPFLWKAGTHPAVRRSPFRLSVWSVGICGAASGPGEQSCVDTGVRELVLTKPPFALLSGADARQVAREVVRPRVHQLLQVLQQERRVELRGADVGGVFLRAEAVSG